jgi:hypothetical protein
LKTWLGEEAEGDFGNMPPVQKMRGKEKKEKEEREGERKEIKEKKEEEGEEGEGERGNEECEKPMVLEEGKKDKAEGMEVEMEEESSHPEYFELVHEMEIEI